MRGVDAANAYKQAKGHRSLRDQEADVFLRVNAALRGAGHGDAMVLAKALADNDRLWTTLLDTMRDPQNALAPELRASLISVGLSVQREGAGAQPDLAFLIGINEQIAAGLVGR